MRQTLVRAIRAIPRGKTMIKMAIAAALFFSIFSFSTGCAASAPNEVKDKTVNETEEEINHWKVLPKDPTNPPAIMSIIQHAKTGAIIIVISLSLPGKAVALEFEAKGTNKVAKCFVNSGAKVSKMKFSDNDDEPGVFRYKQVVDSTPMMGVITIKSLPHRKPSLGFIGTWKPQYNEEMSKDYEEFVKDPSETIKMLE